MDLLKKTFQNILKMKLAFKSIMLAVILSALPSPPTANVAESGLSHIPISDSAREHLTSGSHLLPSYQAVINWLERPKSPGLFEDIPLSDATPNSKIHVKAHYPKRLIERSKSPPQFEDKSLLNAAEKSRVHYNPGTPPNQLKKTQSPDIPSVTPSSSRVQFTLLSTPPKRRVLFKDDERIALKFTDKEIGLVYFQVRRQQHPNIQVPLHDLELSKNEINEVIENNYGVNEGDAQALNRAIVKFKNGGVNENGVKGEPRTVVDGGVGGDKKGFKGEARTVVNSRVDGLGISRVDGQGISRILKSSITAKHMEWMTNTHLRAQQEFCNSIRKAISRRLPKDQADVDFRYEFEVLEDAVKRKTENVDTWTEADETYLEYLLRLNGYQINHD